ncbi:MAG: 23S rRNA (pseudouridine(1915)-N(3))-methyltransferase RlmH, partial [Fibrobacteraceae bacterium]|nr:23S rRNA (pseudouridine(1915)-N(3))-methyltransferase RlmH [Fibrobacteraceae bacterium]
MKLTIAVFGKAGSPFVEEEVEKYTKRLRSSVQLEIVEMKQSKREDQAKSLSEEASEFSHRFPKENYQWIVLAEEGKLLNTVQLASWMKPRLSSNCVFLIGSAYGIDASIKKQSTLLLSLSPLTFTHDHARVILTEQL